MGSHFIYFRNISCDRGQVHSGIRGTPRLLTWTNKHLPTCPELSPQLLWLYPRPDCWLASQQAPYPIRHIIPPAGIVQGLCRPPGGAPQTGIVWDPAGGCGPVLESFGDVTPAVTFTLCSCSCCAAAAAGCPNIPLVPLYKVAEK